MERRSFLKTLAGLAGALAIDPAQFIKDPEKALWVPGAKAIFIPPAKEIIHAQTGIAEATEEELSEMLSWEMYRGVSGGRFTEATLQMMSQEEFNAALAGVRMKLAEELAYPDPDIKIHDTIVMAGDYRCWRNNISVRARS